MKIAARPKSDRTAHLALGGILLLALVLRLWALGKAGLWQDEMAFGLLTRPDLNLPELITAARDYILSVGQMPFTVWLQNLFIRGVQGWVPDALKDPFWMRLPAVVFGLMAVGGVFRLVEQLADRRHGLMAAFLFSVMFFPVYYAREAYCYSSVIAAAAWSTACAVRYASGRAPSWKTAVASAAWAWVLVYSHLNGSLYFGSAGLVTGLLWLHALRRGAAGRELARRLALLLALWTGVLLSVMPYLLRFVFENKVHTSGSFTQTPVWLILQDPVAKMFFGESAPGLVVSWGLFLLGLFASYRRGGPARCLAVVAVVDWLIIGLVTSRSLYLSSRYFAPLAPIFCWLLVAALAWLAARIKFLPKALPALAGIVAVVHVGLFLTPMYGLRDKDLGFARIADWLNQNLEPGTPYLMESAYELRWVSSYHPTPGLIGAAPYVHGSGPGELQRLHQRQIAFMERFPEAPFIQSAHHNVDKPEGLWTWPHQHLASKVRLANEPLRDLVRRGIFIGLPFEKIANHTYAAEIYFNSPEQRMAQAARRGQLASVEFPGWTVGQIAQGEYRRLVTSPQARLQLRSGGAEPQTARLVMRLALDASPSLPYMLVMQVAGQEVYRSRHAGGQWFTAEVPAVRLDQPVVDLDLRVDGQPAPRALLLDEVSVVPPAPRP